jgi:hypothetical protein
VSNQRYGIGEVDSPVQRLGTHIAFMSLYFRILFSPSMQDPRQRSQLLLFQEYSIRPPPESPIMQINIEEESVSMLYDGHSQTASKDTDMQKEGGSSSLFQNQAIEASKVPQERTLDPDLEKHDS